MSPAIDGLQRKAVEPFIARYLPTDSRKSTMDFLETGVLKFDYHDSLEYENGGIWENHLQRSLARKTHGWFFLRYWYAAWPLLSIEEKYRIEKELIGMIGQWNVMKKASDMAFHDETTAQRVINFAVFFDETEADLSAALKVEITALVENELKLLVTEDFHAGLNNHGMFQDIAILVSVALGFGEGRKQEFGDHAAGRLRDYFIFAFGSDGIHRENTPTYHLMVARYLSNIENYLRMTGRSALLEEIHDISEKADLYGAFALTPNQSFVPVSDTRKRRVSAASVTDTFGKKIMLGVLTQGIEGETPSSNTFVSEDSGYGIYRSNWTQDANYLFFSAAYNADYHKHSDELSLYYHAQGRDLISEAGPNGYEYGDPLTRYAFSSAAHNTLLIDGTGLPRTDGKRDKTELRDLGSGDDTLHVEGRTRRFEGVDWSREIEIPGGSNGELVRIADRVVAERERSMTFLWHLGEGLEAVIRANAVEIFDSHTDRKLGELTWNGSPSVSVRRVKGQSHPYYQGWSFPEMGKSVPSVAIEVDYRGENVNVDWELRSSDFKLVDRGVSPKSPWCTHFAEKPVNYLLDGVDEERKVTQLAVVFTAMAQLDDFTYNYRASLRDFSGPVLYILDDFGDQGAYYLSSGRNLAEFRSVQSLIRNVVADLGLSPTDVVTLGSSKGATAALLHGVTMGAGHVYAGAPQYKIGDFVRDPHPNVLRYISGGVSPSSVSWANDIAFKLLLSGVRSTSISVLVGRKDGHHRHHCIPLVDDLRMLGYQVENLVLPGTVHSEFGAVFRKFIVSFVSAAERYEAVILPNTASFDPDTSTFGLVVSGLPDGIAQAQLQQNGKPYGPLQRIVRGISTWKISDPGTYRARIYFDRPDNGERTAFGSVSVRVR